MIKNRIISFIDFFYPPFKKLMPEQTFRYLACGSFNTVVGLAFYFVCYKYILKEQNLDFGFYAFKPENIASSAAFVLNLIIGFITMKYIVFVASNLKGRIQLFRYISTCTLNFFLSILLLKLFHRALHFNFMISQIIATSIIVIFGYLSQKHFTFKVKN